jgi:hypothetical protein
MTDPETIENIFSKLQKNQTFKQVDLKENLSNKINHDVKIKP